MLRALSCKLYMDYPILFRNSQIDLYNKEYLHHITVMEDKSNGYEQNIRQC